MSTTFQKFGGFSAISRIVMAFYEKVLDSDIVGPHFDDVDMPRLIDHQTKFISSLMGGPSAMGDDRLRHVHMRLKITGGEFDEILRLLTDTMAEGGMDGDSIRTVEAAFESKRHLIVSPGAA
ncbi:group I truncated hemoglobin [Ovoidimarina sediminis]|uniref:group I truncated hemoglobin n=1 Tax=Ovoidimarina sediminis TaxID=3079856 RepID=UPI0029086196|nr:group 1 truncated hemoglobin [Rhodophyticola sp. MJ-SS7]MDU8946715.1 group 1 truncated hemoglobin [Rhodophyticola sp. MJ-SS7]